MTSSCRPFAASRSRTGSSSSISSSTRGAWSRSAPLSNSGTTSSTGGRPLRVARRASSYTAAMSAADRVKLTTYRRHASIPNRSWIQAAARNVASTSEVCPVRVPPSVTSRSAWACTALCWRISSSARWNPNVSACQISCCNSPNACRVAPAAARDSWASRRSARKSAARG